jgi:hypothetical protein
MPPDPDLTGGMDTDDGAMAAPDEFLNVCPSCGR